MLSNKMIARQVELMEIVGRSLGGTIDHAIRFGQW